MVVSGAAAGLGGVLLVADSGAGNPSAGVPDYVNDIFTGFALVIAVGSRFCSPAAASAAPADAL